MGIRRAFARLNALLEAKGEQPSYYEETLVAISAVYEYAKVVQDSPDPGKAALHAVLQRFALTGPDPIGTLQRVATGLPEPLNQQVRKLADQTAQVLNIEALRELERRWDADVYSFSSSGWPGAIRSWSGHPMLRWMTSKPSSGLVAGCNSFRSSICKCS